MVLFGNELDADPNGNDSDRNVDQENRTPVDILNEQAADKRPDRCSETNDTSPDSKDKCSLFSFIVITDQRHR